MIWFWLMLYLIAAVVLYSTVKEIMRILGDDEKRNDEEIEN